MLIIIYLFLEVDLQGESNAFLIASMTQILQPAENKKENGSNNCEVADLVEPCKHSQKVRTTDFCFRSIMQAYK